MQTINGAEIAQQILTKLQSEVRKLPSRPLFCDVLIGNDSVATSFVKIKAKRAEEIGLKFELIQLPDTTTDENVISELKKIQRDPFLSGLIVQLPLPASLDRAAIINAIDPRVDVDCLRGEHSKLKSPTVEAVLQILNQLKLDLQSYKILVVGQGELVGKPLTSSLLSQGLNVTTADASTTNLKDLTLEAGIVISAAGSPKLITGEMIGDGAILIDCGTSESSGSIVGDVDSQSVKIKARFLAPVPGGVGPVTVAKLLENVVEVAKDLE